MKLRRTILCTAALVLAGVVFGSTAEAVAAVPPPDSGGTTSANAPISPDAGARTADPQAAVLAYWTPERMRKAIPLPDVVGKPTSPVIPFRAGAPGTTPAAPARTPTGTSAPAGKSDTTKAAPFAVNESAVAGKVFFHAPRGGDYVCSASAINSGSKQMVSTAGHCVHEGRGGNFMQNWIFVPRYRNGARPFGTFAAKQFRTFNTWIGNSDPQRDVGLVTTFPLNGNKLVNVVGGNGLAWNQPRAVAITILAYPVPTYGGQAQISCQGTTRDGGNYTNAINCNFGGGSSGSAWVMNFNNSTGLGQTNGSMSTIDSTGVNRASYFDDAVKAMYDAQGNVT